MDTESSPALNCWNVPQDELLDDLKQLLEEEDFGIHGGQPAAPLDPLTYMNEMKLPRDPTPAAMLRGREWPCTAWTVGLIVKMDLILLDMPSASGDPAAPLGPLTYMNEPEREGPCDAPTVGGGPRMRRTCSRDKSCHRDAPSASEGRRTTTHWTHPEVNRLVAGVEEFGQSGWSEIKKKYFPDPAPTPGARTPGDLKDKWRNMRKACTGDAQTRCYHPLNNKQIKRIKKILGIHDE